MNKNQLALIRLHFIEYANRYISNAGNMRPMMELKRVHCAFVAKNCRQLAVSNGWKNSEVYTAEAIGLLHDVGRFPQLEEFGTFRDDLSINHGERGWQAIQESGLLDELAPDLRDVILNSVRYHNVRIIPDNLPKEHYRWIELIRDADRLDIYRVVLDALENKKYEAHPDILLNLPPDREPSPLIVDLVQQKHPPAYSDLTCVADFLLVLLSWSYQMNYSATLEIMKERKIIERLAAHLPQNNPKINAILSTLLPPK